MHFNKRGNPAASRAEPATRLEEEYLTPNDKPPCSYSRFFKIKLRLIQINQAINKTATISMITV